MQPIINTNTDSFLIYEKHYAYEEVHRQGGFNGLTERVNVLLDAPSQTEREIKLQKRKRKCQALETYTGCVSKYLLSPSPNHSSLILRKDMKKDLMPN